MPFARDKIIINGDTDEGMYQAICAEFRSLRFLADEIQALGKIKETGHFRDALQVLCDAKLKADQTCLDGLRAVKRDMAAFIDQHS